MSVELGECVRVILCGLSEPVRRAIGATLQSGLVTLNGVLFAVEAQILAYDVAFIPFGIARTAISAVVDEAESAARFLPTTIIEGCLDLGDVTGRLTRFVRATAADAYAWLDEYERWFSIREELAAVRTELQETIAVVQAIIDEVLGVCP